jgi:hypothetical protein
MRKLNLGKELLIEINKLEKLTNSNENVLSNPD